MSKPPSSMNQHETPSVSSPRQRYIDMFPIHPLLLLYIALIDG